MTQIEHKQQTVAILRQNLVALDDLRPRDFSLVVLARAALENAIGELLHLQEAA